MSSPAVGVESTASIHEADELMMKQKWQISSLERELEKNKKKMGAEAARAEFLSKNGKAAAQAKPTAPIAAPQTAEEAIAPDPDKQ